MDFLKSSRRDDHPSVFLETPFGFGAPYSNSRCKQQYILNFISNYQVPSCTRKGKFAHNASCLTANINAHNLASLSSAYKKKIREFLICQECWMGLKPTNQNKHANPCMKPIFSKNNNNQRRFLFLLFSKFYRLGRYELS